MPERPESPRDRGRPPRGQKPFGHCFTKVRYRGLAKNMARPFTAFALANLHLVRHRLMPPGERCLC
jgi:hypothetical protein